MPVKEKSSLPSLLSKAAQHLLESSGSLWSQRPLPQAKYVSFTKPVAQVLDGVGCLHTHHVLDPTVKLDLCGKFSSRLCFFYTDQFLKFLLIASLCSMSLNHSERSAFFWRRVLETRMYLSWSREQVFGEGWGVAWWSRLRRCGRCRRSSLRDVM